MSFSTRYMPDIAAILLFALVPVSIHSYARVRTSDCGDWRQLMRDLNASAPVANNARMKEVFDATAWAQGTIDWDPRVKMNFTIARSYDAKRVYHYPELTLLFPNGRLDGEFLQQIPQPRTVEWVETGVGRIPIHRISFKDSVESKITAGTYVLTYRGRAVADPYTAQVQAAFPQMFVGRSPMTLYFVSSSGPADQEAEMQRKSIEWLATAWRQYAHACGR